MKKSFFVFCTCILLNVPFVSFARSGGSFGGGSFKSSSSSSPSTSSSRSSSSSSSSSGSWGSSRSFSTKSYSAPSRSSYSPHKNVQRNTFAVTKSNARYPSNFQHGTNYFVVEQNRHYDDSDHYEYFNYPTRSVEIVQNNFKSIRTDEYRFYYDPEFVGPVLPPEPKQSIESFKFDFYVLSIIAAILILFFIVREKTRTYQNRTW